MRQSRVTHLDFGMQFITHAILSIMSTVLFLERKRKEESFLPSIRVVNNDVNYPKKKGSSVFLYIYLLINIQEGVKEVAVVITTDTTINNL